MECIAAAESNEINVCSMDRSGWRTHKRFDFRKKVVFSPPYSLSPSALESRKPTILGRMTFAPRLMPKYHSHWYYLQNYGLRDAFKAHANRHWCECRASNFSNSSDRCPYTIHVLHCIAETCAFQPGTDPTTIGHMAPGFVTEQWNSLPARCCLSETIVLLLIKSKLTFIVDHLVEGKCVRLKRIPELPIAHSLNENHNNNNNNYDACSDDMRYADLCARAMNNYVHRRRINVDIGSNYKWNILRLIVAINYNNIRCCRL